MTLSIQPKLDRIKITLFLSNPPNCVHFRTTPRFSGVNTPSLAHVDSQPFKRRRSSTRHVKKYRSQHSGLLTYPLRSNWNFRRALFAPQVVCFEEKVLKNSEGPVLTYHLFILSHVGVFFYFVRTCSIVNFNSLLSQFGFFFEEVVFFGT